MNKNARLRLELRPHGIIPPTCRDCIHFEDCGGIQPDKSLFDCFDQYCLLECKRSQCDNVCPYNPNFSSFVAEVDGLRFDDLPPITQNALALPPYLPVIHHASRRQDLLSYPFVVLDTYKVFRLEGRHQYGAVVSNGDELRQAFRLAPSTKILLRGTGKDRPLERFWSYRRLEGVAEQMRELGISLVIGPNYSHFLGVPRTDNLFNRKRQLICLGEFSSASVSPVPHLSAVQPGDWNFWRRYLSANETVVHVAVEFQTGNKNRLEGQKVIDQVAMIQDALRRTLHPLAIGGGQFVEHFSGRFDRFSLIDSKPFMNAVNFHAFDREIGNHPWRKCPMPEGQAIDGLLSDNIAGYSAWITERAASRRLNRGR